jgi:hypothetical protein
VELVIKVDQKWIGDLAFSGSKRNWRKQLFCGTMVQAYFLTVALNKETTSEFNARLSLPFLLAYPFIV